MYMRDDEMANLNIGVFFAAPTHSDPDFFAMKMLQYVLGEYQANKYTGAHLNSGNFLWKYQRNNQFLLFFMLLADRQYNTLHSFLGSYPDITLHKCFYFPYSDTAIFGNYLFGNEVFGHQMLHLSQSVLTEYSSNVNFIKFHSHFITFSLYSH